MKSFNRIVFALAIIAFLALVAVPKFAVQTSAATQTVHQFQTVLAYRCNLVNGEYTDFCATPNGVSVESVLNTYSSQGYQLFTASPFNDGGSGDQTFPLSGMVYTLRK